MRALRVCLAAIVIAALMGLFAPALAQQGSGDKPQTGPNRINRDRRSVLVDPQSTQGGVLPFTGAQLTLFVIIGVGAIGAGALTLRAVRARKGMEQA